MPDIANVIAALKDFQKLMLAGSEHPFASFDEGIAVALKGVMFESGECA